MLTRLQIQRTIDPLVSAAYKKVEEEVWRSGDGNSPHGNPWHVSFHASQFPGDDPMACGRQAMYRMMDLPKAEPFNRRARTVMAAGKAVEYELVSTLDAAGILISAGADDEIQTGFTFADAWLTGSVDCVIQPPGTNIPLPIEIKSKYQEVIEEMQLGTRKPDEGHIFQLKVQLALIRHAQEKGELWADMDLVTHGYIYYLSRDRPFETAEFRVDYDPRFFEMGIERLQEWKRMFIDEILPSENPSKKHPYGWRWSYPPCQWCDFKKTCKLDFEQGVTKLPESVGIARAKLVNKNYDYETARKRVFDRWKNT
jgi:CRISPR/Cas system-associated exonuclease Cas4 (RecB family)